MTFLIRTATPDDFASVAEVRSASDPNSPTTAEEVRRRVAQRDPALYHADLVAEQGGRVVGSLNVGHNDFAYAPWRYWGHLVVHPDFRRRGLGSALFDQGMALLRDRGAREVGGMLGETDAPGRRFLEARGFAQTWERFESRVQTAGFDFAPFQEVGARVAASGVRLISLAELAADPQRDRRLYELDWLLFQDVPMGQTLTKRPFEAWVERELSDPHLDPDLSFVALDDAVHDPLTGPYVGYSTLARSSGGFYYIGMTGALRSHRGQGVAKALKLTAMRALAGRGGGEIRTFNDPPNTAMLAMNAQLGFVRVPSRLRYELKLGAQGA